MDDSQFAFNPSRGVLKPLETKEIVVSFKPTHCQSLDTVFQVSVKDGNDWLVDFFVY